MTYDVLRRYEVMNGVVLLIVNVSRYNVTEIFRISLAADHT